MLPLRKSSKLKRKKKQKNAKCLGSWFLRCHYICCTLSYQSWAKILLEPVLSLKKHSSRWKTEWKDSKHLATSCAILIWSRKSQLFPKCWVNLYGVISALQVKWREESVLLKKLSNNLNIISELLLLEHMCFIPLAHESGWILLESPHLEGNTLLNPLF